MIDIGDEGLQVDGGAKGNTDHKREFGVPVLNVSDIGPVEGELIGGSLERAMGQGRVRIEVGHGASSRVPIRGKTGVVDWG